MWKIFILVIASLLLAGCASAPQVSDEDSCISYGASPGSQAYFQCRMAKDQQRQSTRAALAAVILSRQHY